MSDYLRLKAGGYLLLKQGGRLLLLEQEPATQGGGGSGYFRFKTLTELEREKQIVKIKKKAKKIVVEAIKDGLLTVSTAPAFVEKTVEASIPAKLPDIPARDISAIIARIKAEARRALIRRLEEEDEDDFEVLLLAA